MIKYIVISNKYLYRTSEGCIKVNFNKTFFDEWYLFGSFVDSLSDAIKQILDGASRCVILEMDIAQIQIDLRNNSYDGSRKYGREEDIIKIYEYEDFKNLMCLV